MDGSRSGAQYHKPLPTLVATVTSTTCKETVLETRSWTTLLNHSERFFSKASLLKRAHLCLLVREVQKWHEAISYEAILTMCMGDRILALCFSLYMRAPFCPRWKINATHQLFYYSVVGEHGSPREGVKLLTFANQVANEGWKFVT